MGHSNGKMKRAFSLAAIALLAVVPEVRAQDPARAISPSEVIKLFDGTSLANFDSWLVDRHEADPDRVFSVLDQVDGAPAIRNSGKV